MTDEASAKANGSQVFELIWSGAKKHLAILIAVSLASLFWILVWAASPNPAIADAAELKAEVARLKAELDAAKKASPDEVRKLLDEAASKRDNAIAAREAEVARKERFIGLGEDVEAQRSSIETSRNISIAAGALALLGFLGLGIWLSIKQGQRYSERQDKLDTELRERQEKFDADLRAKEDAHREALQRERDTYEKESSERRKEFELRLEKERAASNAALNSEREQFENWKADAEKRWQERWERAEANWMSQVQRVHLAAFDNEKIRLLSDERDKAGYRAHESYKRLTEIVRELPPDVQRLLAGFVATGASAPPQIESVKPPEISTPKIDDNGHAS